MRCPGAQPRWGVQGGEPKIFFLVSLKKKNLFKIYKKKIIFQIYMKDLNRKKNQIVGLINFYFSSYGHFSVILWSHHPNFRSNFATTRKIKIGNIFYYFSHSIRNIAHHSQSLFDGVISEIGGGVCMSFFVNKPVTLKVWPEVLYECLSQIS